MFHRLRVLALALPFFSAFGCSGSSLGDDLDAFCKVVTEVDQDKNVTEEEKLQKIAARSKEFMRPLATPSDNIWEQLANATSERKYGILLAAAERSGKRGWKCTPFLRLVQTVEAQRVLREMKGGGGASGASGATGATGASGASGPAKGVAAAPAAEVTKAAAKVTEPVAKKKATESTSSSSKKKKKKKHH